jgi:hypothetical protein
VFKNAQKVGIQIILSVTYAQVVVVVVKIPILVLIVMKDITYSTDSVLRFVQ